MRFTPNTMESADLEDGAIAICHFPPYAQAGVYRFVGQMLGEAGGQLVLACPASGCTVFARLDSQSAEVQLLGSPGHLFSRHADLAVSLLGQGRSVGLVLVAIAWCFEREQRGVAIWELPKLLEELERYAVVAKEYATRPLNVLLTRVANRDRVSSTDRSVSTA